MRRFLLGFGLALALGGCAALQNAYTIATGASVTPNQVYIAANAFDAVEATATTYLKLPACGSAGASSLCRTQAAVNAIVPAVRSGRAARNQLEAAVSASGGTPVSATIYSVLTGATNTLQTIISEYGISK